MTDTVARPARPAIAAGASCVVAGLAYSGAVTVGALLAFVLPAVMVTAAATAAVARVSRRAGAVLGVLLALLLAEIVNLASGTENGPAARSSFVAAAFTALAVAAVLGPVPMLFAAAVVGVIVGALGLGAGAEVAPVVVATSVVVVIAVSVVEAHRRRWTRRPPGLVAATLLALLVGAVVATIALQADRSLDGDPAVLAPGAVQPSIRPPQVLGDPDPPPTPTPTATSVETPGSAATPSTTPAAPGSRGVRVRDVWAGVGLVLLAVLLLVGLRVLWVAAAWRLLRRRLRRGTRSEQVAGAWVWSTRRLRAAGWPVPTSMAPDRLVGGTGGTDLPRAVRPALRRVATSTVAAVFAPTGDDPDTEAAWAAADEVGRSAVSTLPPSRRVGFAVRPISSVPSRSAAPTPVTLEEHGS